jgi:hypothetical protein
MSLPLTYNVRVLWRSKTNFLTGRVVFLWGHGLQGRRSSWRPEDDEAPAGKLKRRERNERVVGKAAALAERRAGRLRRHTDLSGREVVTGPLNQMT